MIKNLFGLLVIAGMLISCGGNAEKAEDEVKDEVVASLEFASLIESPTNFLEKDVTVEGKVVHVCTHSGKKMFIVGDDPDIRLFITAGEELPKFPLELLGSTISVTGKLSMVEAGEKTGEGEHKEGEMKEGAEEGEDCETEAAVAAQPVLASYVLHYTSHVEK